MSRRYVGGRDWKAGARFAAAKAEVRAECVCCGAQRWIGPSDVEPGNTPVCQKCYGPMVAKAARASRLRG